MRLFRAPVIANPLSWRRAQADCHAKAHAIPSVEQAQARVTGQVVGIGGVTLGLQADEAAPLIGLLGLVGHQQESAHHDSPIRATKGQQAQGEIHPCDICQRCGEKFLEH
ncbi:hypothetical protein [Aeromonas rivipollensis]|uniref:hypothetical protein n=1 Tax=Aeromonas rivipollensis TaxID=948519 RepID=UPI0027D9A7C6|nr:hypothetical protein [uncultured Aeromonas sp.]MDU1142313.1 hypothetical protein [Aeromonas hydrophila]